MGWVGGELLLAQIDSICVRVFCISTMPPALPSLLTPTHPPTNPIAQETYEKLTDEELRAKTAEFKRRVREQNEDVNGPLLEEAFAVVREAAWRVLQLRHYDVQLMGGMALNEGRLAEMVRYDARLCVCLFVSVNVGHNVVV